MRAQEFVAWRLLGIPLAGFFWWQWFAAPSDLRKIESRLVVADAHYQDFKGGQIVLREGSGGVTVVHCRLALEFCEALKLKPLQQVTVQVTSAELWNGPWIVSADRDGKSLVSLHEQIDAYASATNSLLALAIGASVFAAFMIKFAPSAGAARRRSA